MTDFLRVEDLLRIADGIMPDVQVRDHGLLASAAHRPRTTVFGELAYPTLPEQAAALMHSVARNHALVDGNKRLAWAAMRTFCLLNDHDVRPSSVDAGEAFVLAVAAGGLELEEITEWITAHLSPL